MPCVDTVALPHHPLYLAVEGVPGGLGGEHAFLNLGDDYPLPGRLDGSNLCSTADVSGELLLGFKAIQKAL